MGEKGETQIHFQKTHTNKRHNSLWLIDFSPFFLTHANPTKTHTMSQNKTTETQDTANLEESGAQGDMEAKRKMARRLLFGNGVDKDEAKAVSILEDCVAHSDPDAMVMLAECCAFARGMEHNAERAEALLSDAAEKGNEEARILMQPINNWKGQEPASLWGL